MSLPEIYKGAVANDKTGTPARQAADIINQNFATIESRFVEMVYPDAVLKKGDIETDGLDVHVDAGVFEWRIAQVDFTDNPEFDTVLDAATDGYYRKDLLLGDNEGGYHIFKGDEDPVSASEPNLIPNGTIKLGVIDVYGAVIDGTEPVDLSGYATKDELNDAIANIEKKLPENYTNAVYVNNANPNSATIFSLENPPLINDDLLKNDVTNLYIGLDISNWVYNGTAYVTEEVISDFSNWNVSGTDTDAQNSKSANLSRTGTIEAKSIIKTGSTQDGFLMGNGSDKKIDLDKIINLAPHAFGSNFLENKNIEKSISLNTQRNKFFNSETYTSGNSVVVGTGMSIDNNDTFLYNGVKLSRFKGTAYTSNITLRQAILTAGKRYILSFYVKNNNSFYTENRFIWFNTNNSSSSGHGARFVDNNVRRVFYMFQAAGATGVYTNGSTTQPIGTGDTGFLTMAVTKTFAAPYTDLYIGGIQIEEVPDTYVDGVIWIGDSTIQSNSSTNNYILSVAIPRFFEGIYNCTSYNVAVAGERLDQMDARWATDVTTRKANSKYVVIQGGPNDIAQGRSLADMQASINSMTTKALADSLIPIYLTCTPNQGSTVLQNTQRVDFNNWLKTNFKKVIDINTIVEQNSKIMVGTPNSLYEGDGLHYGVSLKKAVAEFIAKSGFFEFLQPTDYQAMTASYTGKDASVRNMSAAQITTTVAPAVSPGLYDLKTRNQTTGVEEKVPSNTYALNLLTGFTPTPGTIAPTDTVLQGVQKNAGNLALKANASDLTTSGTYTPVCSNNVNFSGGVVDRLATWTRTGNVVNVKFDFIASVTTASTDSSISVTLPFTVATGDHQYIGSGVASLPPYANCFIQALSGETVCTLYSQPSVTTSARYVVNITYIAAS